MLAKVLNLHVFSSYKMINPVKNIEAIRENHF